MNDIMTPTPIKKQGLLTEMDMLHDLLTEARLGLKTLSETLMPVRTMTQDLEQKGPEGKQGSGSAVLNGIFIMQNQVREMVEFIARLRDDLVV